MSRKLVLLYVGLNQWPCVILTSAASGDGACGKTSLLNVFTRGYVCLRADHQIQC